MKTNFPRIAVVLLTMLFVAACSKTEEHFIHPSSENIDPLAKTGAKDIHAFVAHSWMALQLQLIKADGNFTPPVASRSLGFAGFTLYETVVGKIPLHRSIAAQVGAPPMPAMPNHSIDEAIAANKSMHDLLISFFVYPGNPLNALVQQKCDALYAGNFAVLTEKVPPSKITLSETHGAAIAAAVYAWSATDPVGHRGQMRNTDPHYTMTPWPGVWQPTPAAYGMPVQPHWGNARTFVKANAEGACIAVMPIPFSSHASSEFYRQAMEVYEVSRNLTEEQQTIARYWADGAGTITPPGHMMSITMQVLQQEETSLGMAAETYCKVGMALSDAFVACWKGKYTTTLMRPVTYIRQHIQTGWLPMLATPPFPSFASGHATQSGAAAAVLTSLYGSHYTFTDHTHDGLGFQPRNFTSFDQAADEAAISRLYGGIHYAMDNDEGLAAGNIIGRNICSIRFKK